MVETKPVLSCAKHPGAVHEGDVIEEPSGRCWKVRLVMEPCGVCVREVADKLAARLGAAALGRCHDCGQLTDEPHTPECSMRKGDR